MSTTTNYYALTKPELSDPADIRAINGNMDTLDTVLHGSQVSLADAFDQTKAYSAGDVVMYQFYMYKFTEDKAAGNWDATKVERTTAAETGGGEVDFDLFGEASGNPASFADGSASALVECETEIVPVQDLHGYSKPWAGGAGKNKAEGRYQWNVNASGEIISSSNYATCIVNVTQGTTYTFSVDGVKAQIDVIAYFNSYPQIGSISYNNSRDTFIDGTFTAPITGYAVIRMDANIGNMQVEVGSSATAYEPYSNICPISGHSSVTINVSPTNDPSQGVDTTIQLGNTYYGGTLNAVTGEMVVDRALVTITSESQFSTFSADSTYGSLATIAEDGKISNSEIMAIESMGVGISNDNRVNPSYNDKDRVYVDNTGKLRLRASNTVTISTKADMLARFNGVQVCYYLATPITVYLPPTVINTLLGQNYISSDDTEEIDLVYTKSTAPIKPNPSGTPSGELRSIDIGGEIFEIIKELPTFPSSDGDYKLKLSVSSGVPTLSWESDT